MTLLQLAVLTAVAAVLGAIRGEKWRLWGLFLFSMVMLFWLQPATPLRYADFWLPTMMIFIVILSWLTTQQAAPFDAQENVHALIMVGGFLLLISLSRWTGLGVYLTATRPPGLNTILVALVAASLTFALVLVIRSGRWINVTLFLMLMGLFIILKTDVFVTFAARLARTWIGQSPALAAPADLNWLGISYVTFRLMHTLRDQRAGRLPSMTLREYATYVLFFPAIVAGPIDRAERFLGDLRQPVSRDAQHFFEGGKRLMVGMFKKYILAAILGVFALRADLLPGISSAMWIWVLVYAYAFQLFLDFSGYTDVAVGLGLLAGVRLPENFNQPYRKSNLTAFWNSWHITLAQWFRAYFFNPLTRALRRRRSVPTWAIILIGQAGTMVLIGLWHGVTWNFLIWGAWHALGLFFHNRWVDLTRRFPGRLDAFLSTRFNTWLGVALTFHFVSLGWLWFALPSPALAWTTLLRMMGW